MMSVFSKSETLNSDQNDLRLLKDSSTSLCRIIRFLLLVKDFITDGFSLKYMIVPCSRHLLGKSDNFQSYRRAVRMTLYTMNILS